MVRPTCVTLALRYIFGASWCITVRLARDCPPYIGIVVILALRWVACIPCLVSEAAKTTFLVVAQRIIVNGTASHSSYD